MKKNKVLFLCTGNSCRSQMAEGWAKALREDIEAYSAGIAKHGLNPSAVQVMQESGVDISSQKSSLIEELPIQDFDLVITLCGHAAENCPFFPGTAKIIHQGFDDPPSLALEHPDKDPVQFYRRVRDEIKNFVNELKITNEDSKSAL